MESTVRYPDIILNESTEDIPRGNITKLMLGSKPASFEDNTQMSCLELPESCQASRRYSETSIWDYQNLDVALERSEALSRRRRLIRAAEQKSRALDEISIDILKANKGFGGFKQLQKVHSGNKKENFENHEDKLNLEFSNRDNTEEIVIREDDCLIDSEVNDFGSSISTFNVSTGVGKRNSVNFQFDSSVPGKSCGNQTSYPYVKSVHGFRLGYRKKLQERRRKTSDYTLLSALFGIILMVLLQEFQWSGFISKNSMGAFFIKTLITVSTVILISFILLYHILEIKLLSCDDCLEDWKITITWQRVMRMILEVLVCVVHPFPFIPSTDVTVSLLSLGHPYLTADNAIGLDVILSLPMFLRFYIVFRVLLLHSRLFSDATLRSIGAINKVKFDTRFLFKTLLTICPATVFILFLMSMWLFFSWILRACEIRIDTRHNSLLNSTWLIAVTFLSVGYGEIVPHTACGRGIAISSGVMGSACTALIVAVLAKKLELSKAEQHVTHFMMESSIKKKLKHCAANVLRETWLIYKLSKLVPDVNPSKIRVHQRKFLKAIHGLRNIKIDQRKIRDNSNTLVDLAKTIQTGLLKQPSAYISQPVELYRETQNTIFKSVTEMREEYVCFHKRIEQIEKSVINLQKCLTRFTSDLQSSLNL